MSNRPTIIDYADTPASEQSAYFDAPMAAWNKDSSDADSLDPAGDHPRTIPGAFDAESLDSTPSQTALRKKPSVGIPRDPVVRKHPAEGDEDEQPSDIAPEDDGNEDDVKGELHHVPKAAHRRSTSLADSGYASTGAGAAEADARHPQSRGSRGSIGIDPIPVLWNSPSQEARNRGQAMQRGLDGNDGDDDGDDNYGRSGSRSGDAVKRASSLRSFRSIGGRGSVASGTEDRGSVRTSLSMIRKRRVSLSGGSFAGGAGTVGPAASPPPDESFETRSRMAEMTLSEKEKLKLSKAQIKEGKKVAKVIRAEGKLEKKALDEAVRELADIQKLQKAAVKEESKAYAAYAKALREFRKAEMEFLAARAKFERAQADLQAHEDAKEASKEHAQEATEMLQEKNREVEWLRAQKAVDDRERGAKIKQLTGKA